MKKKKRIKKKIYLHVCIHMDFVWYIVPKINIQCPYNYLYHYDIHIIIQICLSLR